MKEEIKVPAMGESITEAIIGTLIKPTGSHVESEDELLELETDKVNQVLYAPKSGVITWNVQPEDSVKIGEVIGFIDTEAAPKQETPKEKPPPKEEAPKEEPSPKEEPQKEKALPKEEPKEEISIRLSIEEALSDLKEIKKAVVSPEKKEEKVKERETRKRMPKIRRVIAKRLVEAQANTAMLTTFNEIDLTDVIAVRTKHKDSFAKEHGVKLGFMSFFVKACVSALQAYPEVNSYIDGEEIVHREYYDIGIAVGTDRGLFVPVLRDCNQLTFAEIEKNILDFATKAREGKISVDDLQGGGFTITNGGVYGSLLSTPILNPPQSGILGMHTIQKRPVALNDQVIIRPMMYVALSYDHRIVDGKEAVSFLVHLKKYLEDPAKLLLDT